MIILITGTPGAGKTLYAVHAILAKEAEGQRPIYVDGIPELKLRHEPSPDVNEWHKWAPDGSLIVVDEVQRVWRPTPSGARVPEPIQQLETHRHKGIDFIIITQHPNLIHQNVRRLVGKHIHLRRTALGVYLYEWPECSNPDSYRSAISKIRWSHPKKSFSLYKSASQHVKVSYRIPPAVYVVGASVIALLGLTYYISHTIEKKLAPPQAKQDQTFPKKPDHVTDTYMPSVSVADLTPLDFVPRFSDMPASAKAYEGKQQIQSVPRVAACIESRTRCICYSQQNTRLDMTPQFCRDWVAGKVFDPFQPDQPGQAHQYQAVKPSPPPDQAIRDAGPIVARTEAFTPATWERK